MMCHTAAPARLVSVASLTLFLIGLTGGSAAHALVEAAAQNANHVESADTAACPTHDHQACQVCRTFRSLSTARNAVVSVPVGAFVSTQRLEATDEPRSVERDPARSPRAPPLA